MLFSTVISLLLTASVGFASPIEERQACSPVGISGSEASRVKASFTASGVVPTLIPGIDPKVKVDVRYGNKAVNLGNKFLTTGELTQMSLTVLMILADQSAETLTSPTLSFSAESGQDPAKTKYSYFLVDPDVPSPDGAAGTGIRVTFLHWEVADAQPSCINNQSPKTVALYQPLTPASTTQHRYTFLVYRQPPNYVPEVITPQLRVGFDVNAYAARGGLTLVGGNFLREAITNGIIT